METIDAQRALKGVIESAIKNINNTPDGNWTLGLVESRTELIQGYWNDFQANNLELQQRRNLKIDKYRHDNVYNTVEENVVTVKAKLYEIKARLATPIRESEQPQHFGKARLPRIEIPTFTGRREDWESFRDLFCALIHEDKQLTDVERLFYLKAHVQGDAKAALPGGDVLLANSSRRGKMRANGESGDSVFARRSRKIRVIGCARKYHDLLFCLCTSRSLK